MIALKPERTTLSQQPGDLWFNGENVAFRIPRRLSNDSQSNDSEMKNVQECICFQIDRSSVY